jgi:polysaccharide biosynthesis/export protein
MPPATQPGMLSSRARQAPPVDIDQLEPAKASDTAAADIAAQSTEEGDRFTFDNATQTWVKVKHADAKAPAASKVTADTATAPASAPAPAAGTATDAAVPGLRTGDAARARGRAKVDEKKAFSSRVIEVDYNQLVRGAANLNVIIRPNDMLYCDTGEVGVVYIGGEIARPGVYNLPTSGKLTLSRLVDAAGGLGQIAIPQRVDLIRRIGGDKEAAIRVNLAAIRNRAEPDIFMKSDDHVIIGTNFWATPLAVIRNGFRMTYGFGFLIDRNWGNDIFGAPPTNVNGQ